MPTVFPKPFSERWWSFLQDHPSRLVTAQELKQQGFRGSEVHRMVNTGQLERVERGVYVLTEHGSAATSHAERLAEVQARYPTTVACLGSAASLLGLTTEEPAELELALPRQRTGRLPQPNDVQFHWMSPAIYAYGQIVDTSSGQALRTFNAAKTVADFCARRHKLGRKTYLGILKTYLQAGGPGGTPGATQPLLEAAQVCRVQSIIRADLAVLRA